MILTTKISDGYEVNLPIWSKFKNPRFFSAGFILIEICFIYSLLYAELALYSDHRNPLNLRRHAQLKQNKFLYKLLFKNIKFKKYSEVLLINSLI